MDINLNYYEFVVPNTM